MIIVKLMGGLGNQMFQYAAGRRLSYVNNTELKLDLGWFSNIAAINTARKYELAVFCIQESFATHRETVNFRKNPLHAIVSRLISKAIPSRMRRHIYEKHYHFDPDILNLPDDVYLEGFWQCPRYFEDIEDIIRKEFTINTAPDDLNQRMAEDIASTESVSIHVRRGDYVSNPVISSVHGICPPEYYRSAVETIACRVNQPHFFVFSDDPAWVKKSLLFIEPATFVDYNGPDKAYEDMRLMGLCKHHIIANSSFSWWGAWLSNNTRKIVIAPKKWFKDTRYNTGDVIPEDWLRI